MSIQQFPCCAAYLKGMHVKLNDPDMTDYWFAVILGDALPAGELKSVGAVFGKGYRNGVDLLRRIEGLLANRRLAQASESLKAFIGARGVKASKLKTEDDFWKVAAILWPDHVKAKGGSLSNLERQIRSLSKKQRQAASQNVRNVPAEFRSTI